MNSGVPIVSVQTQYSLLDRRPERALSVFCAERAVNILAYGALAGGFLSDRWLGSEPPTALPRSGWPRAAPTGSELPGGPPAE